MEGAKGKKKKGKSKGEDDVKENGSVPAAAGEQNGQSVPGDVVRMEAMEIKPPEVVEVDPTCIQPGGECCVRKMKLMQIADKGTDKVKSEEEAKNKNYAFWSTQPVPQIGTSIDPNEIGPIEADKSIEDIRYLFLNSWEKSFFFRSHNVNQQMHIFALIAICIAY